jgi:hypothetical protein
MQYGTGPQVESRELSILILRWSKVSRCGHCVACGSSELVSLMCFMVRVSFSMCCDFWGATVVKSQSKCYMFITVYTCLIMFRPVWWGCNLDGWEPLAMGLGRWSVDRQLDTAPMSSLAARITTASWTQHDTAWHSVFTSIYLITVPIWFLFDRFW